jgi:hypothetical protein
LNRETLQLLAGSRVEEAGLLIRHKHWTGAYYLTGLGVECVLKACLARGVQQYDFPDKGFINRAYTHKLEELAKLDVGFWVPLNNELSVNLKFASNWSSVRQWDDEKRYGIVGEEEAVSLYMATTEPVTGVLEWIQRRW